jgi:hypothetical protein
MRSLGLFGNVAHYDTAGGLKQKHDAGVKFGVAFMSRHLTRLQRMTLVLFLIVVTNWAVVSATGYSLLGGDLFTFFLIVFLVLTSAALAGTMVRKIR